MKPYIGITGFTTADEIKLISQAAEKLGLGNDKDYTLMMGFLTSDNRLGNIFKRGHRSPAFNSLANLLSEVPSGVLPVIHHHTYNPDDLGNQMDMMFGMFYENNLCKAIQINIDWPNVDAIKKTKERFPDLDVVLQLPQNALDVSVDDIVSKASAYEGLVSYVLIDPSAGAGLDYDQSKAVVLLNALDAAVPSAIKGVAGGLCAANVYDQTMEINQKYLKPYFVDAEGKLRTSDWQSLDIGKCVNYLANAKSALTK